MNYQDPIHDQRWMLTIITAMGLAFLLAVGAQGCSPQTPGEPESVDVSGGELPEYDADPHETDRGFRGAPQLSAEAEGE